MTPRPDTNREPRSLEELWDAIREARLEIDKLADRMETRTINGISGAHAFVEEAREHLDERAPKPGPSGGASPER